MVRIPGRVRSSCDVEARLPRSRATQAGGVMTGKVVIITGGSQGIGAGLVAGYRGRGWAVLASARAIEPSEDPDLLTVAADITEPANADRIIDAALERFGRVDTLVNNAGVFISKPFTDYTAADYAAVTRVNAVSPGIIQTPVHPPESYDDLGDRLPPLGRPGQVSDVVDGVLFLESSPYITGEILH